MNFKIGVLFLVEENAQAQMKHIQNVAYLQLLMVYHNEDDIENLQIYKQLDRISRVRRREHSTPPSRAVHPTWCRLTHIAARQKVVSTPPAH